MKRLLWVVIFGCLPVVSGAVKPNLLFAIADDWGRHAGAYGTRWVRTPAFDRIAREGLLFRHAYTPICRRLISISLPG